MSNLHKLEILESYGIQNSKTGGKKNRDQYNIVWILATVRQQNAWR